MPPRRFHRSAALRDDKRSRAANVEAMASSAVRRRCITPSERDRCGSTRRKRLAIFFTKIRVVQTTKKRKGRRHGIVRLQPEHQGSSSLTPYSGREKDILCKSSIQATVHGEPAHRRELHSRRAQVFFNHSDRPNIFAHGIYSRRDRPALVQCHEGKSTRHFGEYVQACKRIHAGASIYSATAGRISFDQRLGSVAPS